MATDISNKSELDTFKRYIDERCGGSLNGHSLEEAIEEFRAYQDQLFAMRERLRLSEESAERDGTIGGGQGQSRDSGFRSSVFRSWQPCF